jgi:hypothetical protein
LQWIILFVAALTCLSVAGIAATVAVKQMVAGTMTMGNHPIPKTIITSVISLGFALSGLQYFNSISARPKGGQVA